MKFAQRIKELRGKQRQADFAEIISIHPVTLSQYESGKSVPGIDVLERICVKFGVSADWLIGLVDSKNGSYRPLPYSPDENRIIPDCSRCETVAVLRDVVKEFIEDSRRAAAAKLK